ncbi:MAG TPA: pantoate--beta-alanine ligase [Gammaproteobacteria bacterium]|nr:pantoate--beta-alanine ligase [Gammaproteobacteria bacterium]
MIVANNRELLRETVQAWRNAQLKIGFVPTMGNLHAGHLALVKEAQQHCDKVIVSIFVNPTQFGPSEDFDRYPRTEQQDCQLLKACHTDLVYLPTELELYPTGRTTKTQILPAYADILCGIHRPGHFSGVAQVVIKLFNLVQPDVAVFGQKDYQQLTMLRQMTQELNFPIEIIAAPTVREEDGLALSSRNQYLTKQQREVAPCLYQTLTDVRDRLLSAKLNFATVIEEASNLLEEKGFKVEYLELRDSTDLSIVSSAQKEVTLLVAAYLGKTRLIDNLSFTLNNEI